MQLQRILAQGGPSVGPAGAPGPEEQQRQGERGRRHGGGVQVRELGGQRARIVQHRALRGAAEDDVQLGDGDGDADPGQHAVHDGGADREGGAGHAQAAETELGNTGQDGDGAGRPPSVEVDEVGGDDREPGGGPLTWSWDPPSRPATRPPTAAAARPAWRGAPVARAMPRDRGRAIRKTAMDADASAPGDPETAGAPGRRAVRLVVGVRSVGSVVRVGTQADMFPVSSGAAVAEQVGPAGWRVGRGRESRRAVAG
ncbi:hypothetical protein SGLAM104S_01164 [Streptomyces glaucescens]